MNKTRKLCVELGASSGGSAVMCQIVTGSHWGTWRVGFGGVWLDGLPSSGVVIAVKFGREREVVAKPPHTLPCPHLQWLERCHGHNCNAP